MAGAPGSWRAGLADGLEREVGGGVGGVAGTTAAARWRALGCDIALVVSDAGALGLARRMLTTDLAALDRAASRFRPDSEVIALAAAGGERRKISPLLADLLGVALDAAQATAGDLDPTVGADLVALGYDRDVSELPLAGFAEAAPGVRSARRSVVVRRPVSWSDVELDRVRLTARIPAGTILDLGATAKAYAADLAAARIAGRVACGVLVGLGGDVAVAGDAPRDGWVIRVQDTTGDPAQPAPATSTTALVTLKSGGLATSSSSARRWRHGGSVVHHILDPRTGAPAPPMWTTVSVAAPTCVAANVASTAAVIRGIGAVGWLRGLGVPARLVPGWIGRSGPVLLGGWPDSAEETAA